MILLIDNYDSFTFNLVHYLGEIGAETTVVRNDVLTVAQALDMKPEAIVLSPGPCTPAEAGICVDLVKACEETDLPLLGVCLGHQSIGAAFGGRIVRAPVLMHGKTSDIFHEREGLFATLPSPFAATRYHSLIIEEESLPHRLAVTARTSDGLIMGVQHRTREIHGVQFHPESIATQYGHELLRNFLDRVKRKGQRGR